MQKNRLMKILWALVFLAVLAWSAIRPADRLTWWLEVLPALIAALLLLWLGWRRVALTPLLYWLILAHCVVLMVGGHYTYAEVPLFDWLAGPMGWQRNNYDKLGHFMQGFVPVMIAREIMLRRQIVNGRGWLALLAASVTLAISALYELIEWQVALVSEQAAEAFLGMQGYVWDTQSDMAWALAGALAGLVLLGRWHDRQLARLHSTAR